MYAYATKDIKRLFGIGARMLQSLTRAGLIHPVMQSGKSATYSFQDQLVLRLAHALGSADIAESKVLAALANITPLLPGAQLHLLTNKETPATSGHTGGGSGRISVFEPRIPQHHSAALADGLFERAERLEATDTPGAIALYRAALTKNSHHVEARINLGRLLHLDGDHVGAEQIYRAALTANAILSFNLGLLLEDLERESEAIVAYRHAVAHDPSMADAHFNLARIHENAGRTQDAFRHLLAYHRLTRPASTRARSETR
jgi:tetratricopeptide (TPR) repeat protein